VTTKKLHKPDNWKLSRHQSIDGVKLRYGHARPQGKSKGAVVVTGGYGRHIEYYYEQINNWVDRGYEVFAVDWAGQGGSSREKPNKRNHPPTRDFEEHADIFHDFMLKVVKPNSKKTCFLSSHSMGGNITLRYLKKYEDDPNVKISGTILAAPMVDINTRFMSRSAFSKLVNTFRKAKIEDVPLTIQTQLIQDFRKAVMGGPHEVKNDPLREKFRQNHIKTSSPHEIGLPTFSWFRAALDSCEIVNNEKFLKSIKTPVFIITPLQDNLVCIKSQKKASDLIQNGSNFSLNSRHGIWYERDEIQNVIWSKVDNFVQNCISLQLNNNNWISNIKRRLSPP
jgi:lysophospholipase